MRKFKILKWPNIKEPRPDLTKAYDLLKELPDYDRNEIISVLDVEGMRMYFYPDEVKEMTNEGD